MPTQPSSPRPFPTLPVEPAQPARKSHARPRAKAAPGRAGTRDRLVEAAIKCFAARGFQGAGIRWIAAEAGSNSALVAYHFGDKAGLYQEALRTILNRRSSRLVELLPCLPTDPGTPREQVVQGLRRYLEVFEEKLMDCDPSDPLDAASLALVSREIESPRPECEGLLLAFVRPFASYLDRCIHALRPDLDEEARFAAFLGIQGSLVFLRHNLGLFQLLRGAPITRADLDRLVQNLINFILGELHGRSAEVQPAN